MLALGVVTFLVTAKAHGRQLRIERELAGYHTVTFRGDNPPFVTRLWRRERYIFWATVVIVAAVDYFLRLHWALAYVLVPGIAGFVVGGALSLARSKNGSILWWGASIVLATALIVMSCSR